MKVRVKDVPVRYNGEDYLPGEEFSVDDKHFDEKLFVQVDGEESNGEDYFTYSAEELAKVKNDDLKAFLDKEQIPYASDDKKEDLIKLIIGE